MEEFRSHGVLSGGDGASARSAWLTHFLADALADCENGAEDLSSPAPNILSGSTVRSLIPRQIWMYWGQGWDAAPPLVAACRDSWIARNPGWSVITLDDASADTFGDLGGVMSGKSATLTAYSDVLRLHLLSRHGGVWADATSFCGRPLDEWLPGVAQGGFFAFSRPAPDRLLSTWFLASEIGGYVVERWRELARAYWEEVEEADFYFWCHYLFAFGCRADPVMKALWRKTPKVSAAGPHRVQVRAYETAGIDDVLAEIAQARIPVHKLSWRMALPEPGPTSPLAALLATVPSDRTHPAAARRSPAASLPSLGLQA